MESRMHGNVQVRFGEGDTPYLKGSTVPTLPLDLWATSNVVKAGHRIRVEIASSNFPRFDRNPNTGKRVAEDSDLKPALQTILHNVQYPSHITLPIVPR